MIGNIYIYIHTYAYRSLFLLFLSCFLGMQCMQCVHAVGSFLFEFLRQMAVDRKSLCILAETEPASFKCVVDEAKRQVTR